MNIKLFLFAFTFLLAPISGFPKNCEDCSAGKPCKIVVPKGDKCNTCDLKVHCSDESRYQLGKNYTYPDCTLFTPVETRLNNKPLGDQVNIINIYCKHLINNID